MPIIEAFTITSAAKQDLKAWTDGDTVKLEQGVDRIYLDAAQARELAEILPKLATQVATPSK